MRTAVPAALADAATTPFWLDDPDAPEPRPRHGGATRCDLAVIGGGFTGLWAALLAKEADPDLDVLLLEGQRIGWAASGRNGGFCAASLTHGLANGLDRFPGEIDALERLGRENLDGIAAAVEQYGIDCDFRRTGELALATEPYQVGELQEYAELARRYGHDAVWLDGAALRAEVDSPTYLGGVWDRSDVAMCNPARLVWGLAAAGESLGVRVREHSPVRSVDDQRDRLLLATPQGSVSARRVVLATNVFPPLLRRLRAYLAPVYDYVLMTEPLSAAQRESIGWRNRQGLGDSANQFHYYRISADNRILFGGYDAIYHYGNGMRAELDQRPTSFARLAEHFAHTFPQLSGVGFSHAWGGAIDTCSRFCPFFGRAYGGKLAYAAGFTGLGVGASRFAGKVALELCSGQASELTRLRLVRSKPVPFPPEPLRYAGIQLTRWSLDRADRRQGRRNLWLRALDRAGLGFDS
ncbi:MAG: NAD(P)/FAD-dependent oxidoreductase [Sciscionella sp.]